MVVAWSWWRYTPKILWSNAAVELHNHIRIKKFKMELNEKSSRGLYSKKLNSRIEYAKHDDDRVS